MGNLDILEVQQVKLALVDLVATDAWEKVGQHLGETMEMLLNCHTEA